MRIFLNLLFAIAVYSFSLNEAFAQLIKVETDTNLSAVYLIENKNSDLIELIPVFRVGEVDSQGPEGLSHYLEHLMFWHADQVNGKVLHGRGGGAWVNGIYTAYRTDGVTSELDDLFTFAQRLLSLPDMSEKFMLDEKRVVVREYDYRVTENPHRQMWQKMNRSLYSVSPLKRSTIGTPSSIMSLSLKDANAFHEKYYHPANMSLIVVGDLSKQLVRGYVEKYFGKIDAGSRNIQKWRREKLTLASPKIVNLSSQLVETGGYKYRILAPWTGSGDRVQDYYTMAVARELLNSALPGGLAKPLRLDNFIASEFGVYLGMLVEGLINISFEAKPDDGIPLEQLAEATKLALQIIVQKGIEPAVLERIIKRLTKTATRRAVDSEYLKNRALSFLTLDLEPNNSSDQLMRLKLVTKAHVDDLLKAMATPVRQVEGFLRKQKTEGN